MHSSPFVPVPGRVPDGVLMRAPQRTRRRDPAHHRPSGWRWVTAGGAVAWRDGRHRPPRPPWGCLRCRPPTRLPTWKQAWDTALYGAGRVLPAGVAGGALPDLGARLPAVRAGRSCGMTREAGLDTVVDIGAGRGELLTAAHALDPELDLLGVEVAARPAGLTRRDRLDHRAARVRRRAGGRQRVARRHPVPRRRGRPRRRAAGGARRPRHRRGVARVGADRQRRPAVAGRLAGALVAPGRARAGHPRGGRHAPATPPGPTWSAGSCAASPSPSTTATPATPGRRSGRCAPTATAARSRCSRTARATSPRTSPWTPSPSGSAPSSASAIALPRARRQRRPARPGPGDHRPGGLPARAVERRRGGRAHRGGRARRLLVGRVSRDSASGADRQEQERREQDQVHGALQPGGPPGTTVRMLTTTVSTSSTICTDPRPSSSGPSSQIDATAMAGMVSPMLAIAEP